MLLKKKGRGGLCVFICMDFASVVSGLEGSKGQKHLSSLFHGLSPVYVHITSLRLTDLKRSPGQCLYPKHSTLIVIKKGFNQNK